MQAVRLLDLLYVAVKRVRAMTSRSAWQKSRARQEGKMIKRIYIDNFRCFSNFELRPDRINLLFGANGAGKSSFVDALERLVRLALGGHEVEEIFTLGDLTRWDDRVEQRFELDLEVDGEVFVYGVTLCSTSGAGMTLREERVSCGSQILFRYEDGDVHLYRNNGSEGTSFPFRGNRSFLGGIEERPETSRLTKFLTRLGTLRSYKLQPATMGSVSHEEQTHLLKDGMNFASWYRSMSQERAGDLPQLFDRLGEALPGFKALALKGAGKQGRTRDLVVQMRTGKEQAYELDFENVSDGQRALTALYAVLMDVAAGPQILLMDEPENYVGISELQPWLQALDEALGDRGQLFLISHHPEGIDYLAPENPLLFERHEGGPVRVRVADFDRDTGLKASEQIAEGLLDAK